ncbi:diguanylate cyclase domain-containing protein, partial [Magnetococcales bacterium HHB-1]
EAELQKKREIADSINAAQKDLLDQLKQKNEQLKAEIVIRQKIEQKMKREFDSRMTINKLLETSLAPMPFTQQLETILDLIFSFPWFALQSKGSIFITDSRNNQLQLVAQRGFRREQILRCATIKPGECLCGLALQQGETIFAANVDHRHHIHYDHMPDHGHYCLPVKQNDKVVGVLNLYVEAGHVQIPEEKVFLDSVTSTLAILIERNDFEQRLKQQAEYDELTNLPNRALFHQRLKHTLTVAERNHKEAVLLFIDLDGFKPINDTLGHDAGDALLQKVAQRLITCVRETDTVARLGGDEFTIILAHITHVAYVEFVVRRILEEVNRPYTLPQGEASISASIGIAIYPTDSSTQEQLIQHADTAMYQAKQQGRNQFFFYSKQMGSAAKKHLKQERDMKKALENSEFQLYFQPKINTQTDTITSLEALIRWSKPDGSTVSPADFIPLAERSGFIVPLGEWIIKTACAHIRTLIDKGWKNPRIAINISQRQLKDHQRFIQNLLDAVKHFKIKPEYLELEIT